MTPSLGTTPERGRFFADDEDGPGTMRDAVVISDRFWRQKMSADPAAVGTTIRINGQPFTVIGITRPEFANLSPLVKPDLWTTLGTVSVTRPSLHLDQRSVQTFQVVGRLADGVTTEAAERELKGVAKQIAAENPTDAQDRSVDLYPFTSMPTEARTGVMIFMAVLMAFAGLILFVACGNVASMLLARSIQRRRELAIRTALGAGRAQLLAQLTTETIVLFLGGAVVALGLAFVAARAITAFRPPLDIPLQFDVPLDWRVFGFTLAVAVVVGALFGLLPGLRSTRVGVEAVLKEEVGSISGRSRARSAVVVGQLAFTFVLLVAAGLVVRALSGALQLDPGFDRRGVYVAITDVQMARLDETQSLALTDRWRAAVAGTPGVDGAALVTRAPLSAGSSTNNFKIEGSDGPARTQWQSTDWAAISPGFFTTLGIRIIAGRPFNADDTKSSERVTIVSEALAKKYFTDAQHAIGRVLQTGSKPEDRRTIVGVAANIKVRSLSERPREMMYEPLAQVGVRNITLLARSNRPDIGLVVRRELRRANAAMPLMGGMSYDAFIGIALLPQRMAALVASVLGIAGLLLAVLGVYGIVAYTVAQRTREIGIRVAIGAEPWSVVALMASAGLRLIGIGVGIGLLLSLAGTRALRSFLLGVNPTDPIVFAAITLGLSAIALIACAVPARRAAKVDPLSALRA